MMKPPDNTDDEELLDRLDNLIDGRDADRGYTNSFLRFCARLLSIKPEADPGFESSLEQMLLQKHPVYAKETARASAISRARTLSAHLGNVAAMARGVFANVKPSRRLAFGSVPALVIALALILVIGSPRVEIARAVEIMESDPLVSDAIEKYDLSVKGVKVWKDLAYIFLHPNPDFDQFEVTIIVDLSRETVWKIVAHEGEILSKSQITGYFDDKEAYWAEKKKEFAAEAGRMGMTLEEYKAHLHEQEAAEFAAKAESMGMTPEEYKAYLIEQKAAKVEAYLADEEEAN